MAPPVIMHVNYCEQGQTIVEMCHKAVAWGFDGIEFRRLRKNVPESTEEYLDAITAAKQSSGLRHVLFGAPGPDLTAVDANARVKDLMACEEFYKLAAERFSLTVCNVFGGSLRNPDSTVPSRAYEQHGSAIATEAHWRQTVEGFQRLGDLAQKMQFQFAFETHMNYLHDTPVATRKLVEMIDRPAVGINLDYGNAVYLQGTPSVKAVISLCADKLFYVHLKNSVKLPNGDRLPVGLGEGDINQREFLRTLRESGYGGPICIEAPRAGDREWYAQQDLAYVRSVLRDLEW